MDSTLVLAAIIAAAIVIPTTAGIIMGGLYFITCMKQDQLNLRENIRLQKALAQNGQAPGGETDLMSLITQIAPALLAAKTGQQQSQNPPNKEQ